MQSSTNILDGNNDNGDDNGNNMTLHLMSVKDSITEMPGNLETVSPVHISELILLECFHKPGDGSSSYEHLLRKIIRLQGENHVLYLIIMQTF